MKLFRTNDQTQPPVYVGPAPSDIDEFVRTYHPVIVDEEGNSTPVENWVRLTSEYTVVYTTIEELKRYRQKATDEIVVTLSTGEILDGDELSQTRIARAIVGLSDDTTTISWIDANNDVQELNKSKLQEALTLAGQAQATIWNEYNAQRSSL